MFLVPKSLKYRADDLNVSRKPEVAHSCGAEIAVTLCDGIALTAKYYASLAVEAKKRNEAFFGCVKRNSIGHAKSLDLEKVIAEKMAYNAGRDRNKHGKRY